MNPADQQQQEEGGKEYDKRVIIAIDTGTTKMKVCLFDAEDCSLVKTPIDFDCVSYFLIYQMIDSKKYLIQAVAVEKKVVDGTCTVEIDPVGIWEQFCDLLKKAGMMDVFFRKIKALT
jgi:glycerol kinase